MKIEQGRCEVVTGSMFCGKTEELIRRARRAVIAKQEVQVFKPSIDNRYNVAAVTSHDGSTLAAQPIECVQEIFDHLHPSTTVIVIDEAQFFDWQIVSAVQRLICMKKRVIVGGLDTDFRGEPFGFMPQLLAIAHDVTKLHAICVVCHEEASRTQRMVNGKPAFYDDTITQVGGSESYEARCEACHEVPRQ